MSGEGKQVKSFQISCCHGSGWRQSWFCHGRKVTMKSFRGIPKNLCFPRGAVSEHLCGSPDRQIWRCWNSQTGAFLGQVVRRKAEAAGALPAREKQGQCCPVRDNEAGAVHHQPELHPMLPKHRESWVGQEL